MLVVVVIVSSSMLWDQKVKHCVQQENTVLDIKSGPKKIGHMLKCAFTKKSTIFAQFV